MSAFVVGLLTGVLSGCGIGGGSLLLLWLTLVQDMPQFFKSGFLSTTRNVLNSERNVVFRLQ